MWQNMIGQKNLSIGVLCCSESIPSKFEAILYQIEGIKYENFVLEIEGKILQKKDRKIKKIK